MIVVNKKSNYSSEQNTWAGGKARVACNFQLCVLSCFEDDNNPMRFLDSNTEEQLFHPGCWSSRHVQLNSKKQTTCYSALLSALLQNATDLRSIVINAIILVCFVWLFNLGLPRSIIFQLIVCFKTNIHFWREEKQSLSSS